MTEREKAIAVLEHIPCGMNAIGREKHEALKQAISALEKVESLTKLSEKLAEECDRLARENKAIKEEAKKSTYSDGFTDGYAVAKKEQPDIIHCAECEYYSTNGQKDCNGKLLYYCGRYSGADYVAENSFCSWAERREE